MKLYMNKLHNFEFEYRIFISLSIVLFMLFLSYSILDDRHSITSEIGSLFNISEDVSNKICYSLLIIHLVFVSGLRMWAGSLLTSKRVMSFTIRDDAFVKDGPYKLVRNPIYLADWLAMCGFTLCLPFIGILLPILFYLHYNQLIKYEEKFLSKNFSDNYKKYLSETPRFIPSIKSITNFLGNSSKILINRDGFRHNALYLAFIPGFAAAVYWNNFFYAVIIGSVGVIEWGITHTLVGTKRNDNTFSVKRKKVFENVLYANCWEDPHLDRAAFNITNKDVVFTITSGGCNALTFLLDDPLKVISLDLNPYQNYLLELKIAAFLDLNYEQLLEFIGVRNSSKRLQYYEMIKHNLTQNAVLFWDANPRKIAEGIIHCGRYERYMNLLRKCLNILIGKNTIKLFFKTADCESRAELFDVHWNNNRWKFFTKVLLSRNTMSLLFDKAFFNYLEESFSFGKHFAAKAKYALTKLPLKENYFLSYILLGKYYSEEYLPDYLQKKNYDVIKNRVSRITIITGSCDHYFHQIPNSCIDKFNFTNIFEWMSAESFENLLKETVRAAKVGAIITYRNLLVKREHPDSMAEFITSNKSLAKKLHEQDLSFIYNNYVVEKIIKKVDTWDTKLEKQITAVI